MGSIFRLVGKVTVDRLRQHPLRSALTLIGVLLGVAVLVAVTLVNRSVLKSVESAINDISGKADLQISGSNIGVDEGILEQIRQVPGVYKVTPIVQETARIVADALPKEQADRLRGQQLTVLGIHFLGEDDYFRTYNSQEMDDIKKDPLLFLNSGTNLILSEGFARRHGFKIKDKIPLMTPSGKKEFTIWGFIRDEKLGRALGGALAVMYYQAAQVSFERGPLVDRFDVAVKPGTEPESVRHALSDNLGKGYQVERPERRTERVRNMLQAFTLITLAGSFLALVVGMFLIYNTVSISVAQRKQEIGVLRALGATRRQVLGLFVMEGALFGVLGSVMGTLFGLYLARLLLVVMTRAISEAYLQISSTDVQIDLALLVSGSCTGIVCSVLSALWPARQASRVNPVETIRPVSLTPKDVDIKRLMATDGAALALGLAAALLAGLRGTSAKPQLGYVSILCLMLGVTMLMPRLLLGLRTLLRPILSALGITAQMAGENFARNLSRTSVTAAALMVAMATTTAFSVFIGSFERSMLRWVDQTIPADLFITSSNPFATGAKNAHMSNDMHGFLTQLPGVKSVDRVRIVDQEYRDLQIKLLSLDWDVNRNYGKFTFMQGNIVDADRDLSSGTGILISENLARRCQHRVGESIELSTPSGPRSFRITGVVIDYSSDQGLILISRKTYVELWRDTKVDTYKLYLSRSDDIPALRQRINGEYGGRYTLYILSNAEFKEEIRKVLGQVFQIVDAMQIVAMLIAVLGIINAMMSGVLDRVRELGVLRALGGLRGQVRRLIMLESALLGFAAAITGIAAGLAAGWIMLKSVNVAQTGWVFPYTVPVGSLTQSLIIILIASALAGWFPARQALRMRITDAIKYE